MTTCDCDYHCDCVLIVGLDVAMAVWNFPNHNMSYHTFGTIGFVMNRGTELLDLQCKHDWILHL
jgi:hypothetical protein